MTTSFTRYLADWVCETVEEHVKVGDSIANTRAQMAFIREDIESNGEDPDRILARASSCDSGEIGLIQAAGYGGFGPLIAATDYSTDRGSCGPRGDLGGTATMMSHTHDYTLTAVLEMTYTVAGVIEHSASEWVDLPGARVPVAYEFYMPGDLPAGGTCEVVLAGVWGS